MANVVRKSDQETGGFHGVGHERYTGRGARVDQFEDLRNLDDCAGADDGETQSLGDGQRCTFGVFVDVQIEQKGAVAGGADEGDDGIVHWLR